MWKRFVIVVIIQTRASSQCMSEKKLSDIDWKVNIYFLNSNSMRRSDDILRIASLSRPRAALFFPRGLEKTSYRTFLFESGNEVGCEGKRGTRRRCLPKNVWNRKTRLLRARFWRSFWNALLLSIPLARDYERKFFLESSLFSSIAAVTYFFR